MATHNEQEREHHEHEHHEHHVHGPGYATPQAAIEESTPEAVAYVVGLYTGSDIEAPDFIGVVDVDPDSDMYQEIIDRVEMPNRGDELHHFGWNACSSSCHVEGLERQYLVVPGNRSGRLHILDTKDRRHPEIETVIEPEEVHEYDLSGPHTVHCIPDGEILISMTGNADGESPSGFLELNDDFEIEGRWDPPGEIDFNYDFWYQPRHNVMVSSEWAAPVTYQPGFDMEDVEAGKYGRRLHIWNWSEGTVEQTIDLGEEGLIPLETRFLHTPESVHGYVNAALSSNIFHFFEEDDQYHAEKVIDFESREHEDWDMPVPALPTDILISMDDRYLFGSNWVHGEVWMYDISDPSNPRKVDSISIGGYYGDIRDVQGRELVAGPQMLQLSLDGERLYWTTSLYSTWDDQFFPEEKEHGSVMLKADVDPRKGTLELDEDFLVDFGNLPDGPARAHEIRWPDGDCTSDVWQ
ncbi:selenium-binding protein (plasmid) [Haloferax mediterranei ATCC 33500]|uniref:Selenium-binding protein n=1 Tax=Haloferax mediterranei (strain ATCC 33500 / DSM 1411 / JCM 8866 / NBRC 14739 / NCIMB 2177 / R-4) TaxID=523841 RepID=I3R9R0_HALMT|nr:selenium-binding protein SBP56-related protein [Haloferax mediterranei]AFK20970.1 selenium-binding protein [Haloferax mediterranei ATCC 33500]AHZ24166.1 selenium-binding protein [Haloferax mediterranei ATCC 33500]EMA05243.1 selenium-binding protein [Haloferax mediterranei ATCC 33500]MDX5989953.1 selenium-binding protein SBP56-related protein [Haloferax mediterranei ATCC 33500]QCQ77141.1 selenium-binding protein [Haloferax mediterranei ATCC 33500]